MDPSGLDLSFLDDATAELVIQLQLDDLEQRKSSLPSSCHDASMLFP